MKKLAIILTALISTLASAQQHYPIKNMLGTNLHEWDIMVSDPDFNNTQARTDSFQKAIVDLGVTAVRIYVDVSSGKSEDNTLAHWSPNRRGWRIDSGLLMLKNKIPGFTVLYTLQGAPANFQAGYDSVSEKNSLYVRKGDDRLNPASWSYEAHDAFILASRGGTNKNVPDYPIYIPDNTWETRQTYYKGAGFIDMLSPSNEPDNQYTTTPLNGYGMAAMSAPFYDSAKKADPNIIVSSPGVASDDTVYLSQILAWNKTNRGGKQSFDEYEFHSYGSGMWTYNNNIANGIPPEESTIKGAKKLVQYASQHGVIPYVGEHSYDQHEYSWLGITPISNYTPSERVAYWGFRELMGYAVSGIKRAFYYKLYQDWNTAADSSEGLFATSSLLVQQPNGHIQRRLIGDMYHQLKEVGDFVYDRTIIDNDTVKLYVFKNGTQELYTGWTVEQIGTTYDRGVRTQFTERFYDYQLNVSGTQLEINEDSSGVFIHTPFNGGKVTLSSKPFLILQGTVLSPLPVHLISFTADKFSKSVVLKWVVQDAAKIEVERSADGRTWINFGEGILNKLVDMHPVQGKNYYRLKMFEPDGSFTYSYIRTVQFTGHSKVNVYNVSGQLLRTGTSEDIEGWKSGLRPGIYYFRYDNSITEPFIKQ